MPRMLSLKIKQSKQQSLIWDILMQAHMINMDIIHTDLHGVIAIRLKKVVRLKILQAKKRMIGWIKSVCFHRAEKYGVQSVVEREYQLIFGPTKAQRVNAIIVGNSTVTEQDVISLFRFCQLSVNKIFFNPFTWNQAYQIRYYRSKISKKI